jgi:hypothetical protein
VAYAPLPSMEIVSDVASWYDHDTVIVVGLVHDTSDGMFND